MKIFKSLAILAAAALSLAACTKSSEQEGPALDKSEFNTVLAEAQALSSAATTD